MKIQVDDGVVEVVTLPKGDIRLTIGDGNLTVCVTMTSREAAVVIAALEAAKEDCWP